MKEKAIIKKLQAGNEEETEQLIKEYYPFVYSYLYRRCGNQEQAKELTQETFYRFFRNIQQYQARNKLLNYLYRIALHLIYDETKKKHPVPCLLDMEQVQDEREDIQTSINRAQSRKDVRRILQMLPTKHKDILILRFYQDLKFKDIAIIMDMPVSTIKSRYRAALKLVEQYWKEGETA